MMSTRSPSSAAISVFNRADASRSAALCAAAEAARSAAARFSASSVSTAALRARSTAGSATPLHEGDTQSAGASWGAAGWDGGEDKNANATRLADAISHRMVDLPQIAARWIQR
jgi:hypothetical protein